MLVAFGSIVDYQRQRSGFQAGTVGCYNLAVNTARSDRPHNTTVLFMSLDINTTRPDRPHNTTDLIMSLVINTTRSAKVQYTTGVAVCQRAVNRHTTAQYILLLQLLLL